MTDEKPGPGKKPAVGEKKRREELVPPPGPLGALSPSYRIKRRQQRIREEIERSKAGDHKVPTWVLVVILLVLLGGWLMLILLS
jgi:hypothetical protein